MMSPSKTPNPPRSTYCTGRSVNVAPLISAVRTSDWSSGTSPAGWVSTSAAGFFAGRFLPADFFAGAFVAVFFVADFGCVGSSRCLRVWGSFPHRSASVGATDVRPRTRQMSVSPAPVD